MKEKIFKFIQIKTPNLFEVLDVKLKDTDDEYGFVNEHYIVKCLLKVPDPSYPVYNLFGRKEQNCLVKVSEYNSWLKGEDSIRWI
jgi:hypothetical protein